MNWSDFFVKVFGNSASKNEMELLNSWKQESKGSVNKLSELSKPSSHLGEVDLSTYKHFDVNSALELSMAQIRNRRRTITLKYVLGAALVLILLAISFKLNSFSSSEENRLKSTQTYIAEKGIFEDVRSDGTKISFAQNTNLEFDSEQNAYNLSGTAFFDVVKQEKPLQIYTNQGKVIVIGTSFDITVNGDLMTIFMHEGSVSFTDLKEKSHSVSAGQLMTSDKGIISIVDDAIDQTYTYWRTKKLVYNNASLSNIISDLSRLYDKSFPSITKEAGDLQVTVVFENSNFSDIVSELEAITKVSLLK